VDKNDKCFVDCARIEVGMCVYVNNQTLVEMLNSTMVDMFDLHIIKKDDLFEVKFLDKKI